MTSNNTVSRPLTESALPAHFVSTMRSTAGGSFGQSSRFDSGHYTKLTPRPSHLAKNKCNVPHCENRARYAHKNDLIPLSCKKHKENWMVLFKCDVEDCKKEPLYNYKGEIKALFCDKHKNTGMVNTYINQANSIHTTTTLQRWPDQFLEDADDRKTLGFSLNRNRLVHVAGPIYSGGIQIDDMIEKKERKIRRQLARVRNTSITSSIPKKKKKKIVDRISHPSQDRTAWIRGAVARGGIGYCTDVNTSPGPASYVSDYMTIQKNTTPRFADTTLPKEARFKNKTKERILLDQQLGYLGPGPGEYTPRRMKMPKGGKFGSDNSSILDTAWRLHEARLRSEQNRLIFLKRPTDSPRSFDSKINDLKASFYKEAEERRILQDASEKDRSTFLHGSIVDGYFYGSKESSSTVSPASFSQMLDWSSVPEKPKPKKKRNRGSISMNTYMMRQQNNHMKSSSSSETNNNNNEQDQVHPPTPIPPRKPAYCKTSAGFVYTTAPRQVFAQAKRFPLDEARLVQKAIGSVNENDPDAVLTETKQLYYPKNHELSLRKSYKHDIPMGRWNP